MTGGNSRANERLQILPFNRQSPRLGASPPGCRLAALPGMRPCGLPTRGWWFGLHGDHFLLLLLLRHRSFFAKDRQEDDGGDVVSVSWQNIVANAMGIPGLVLAIWLLRRLGTKILQVYGFVLIAGMFLVLGVLWETCPDNHILLFVAYCFLQFSLNWGPNLSTFVLPSEVYPPGVRSSFNGASAALGKIGALVGGFTFQPIYDQFGMFAVMATCAVISLVGALVTHLCIENDMAREQRKSFNKPGYRPGPPQKAENAEHLLA